MLSFFLTKRENRFHFYEKRNVEINLVESWKLKQFIESIFRTLWNSKSQEGNRTEWSTGKKVQSQRIDNKLFSHFFFFFSFLVLILYRVQFVSISTNFLADYFHCFRRSFCHCRLSSFSSIFLAFIYAFDFHSDLMFELLTWIDRCSDFP